MRAGDFIIYNNETNCNVYKKVEKGKRATVVLSSC